MLNTLARKLVALSIVIGLFLLFGGDRLPIGAENKINQAVPVSDKILDAKKAAIDELPKGQRKAFDIEWGRRITLRALTCAKGYSPPWYTAQSAIRERLTDVACFHEHDTELAKWVGYQRIGITLAKPALKPIPVAIPKVIVGENGIRVTAFASNAGIAVFESANGVLQLVDLNSGQVLRRDKVPEGTLGRLSPNGRILTIGDPSYSHVQFFSTETGEEIGRVPKTREWQIHWVGNDRAIYTRATDRRGVLVDFTSGQETELPVGEVSGVFSVPDQEHQYILGTFRGAAKIEFSRKDGERLVNVIDEWKSDGNLWSINLTAQTSDGELIVNSEQAGISFLNIRTLGFEKVDFGPGANIQKLLVTEDPDKIILRTNAVDSHQNASPKMRDYVYSISGKAIIPLLSPIPEGAIYIRSLKRLMAVSGDRIEAYQPVVSSEMPLSMQQVASERRIVQTERKLAEADRLAGIVPNGGYATAPVQSPPIRPPVPPPLANLVVDARIEAVGVYQGPRQQGKAGESPKVASIEVRVRRSDKPIVLVLASYEEVRWMITSEPGARIHAVLLSGYKQSTVSGGGSARVVSLGQKYAYQMGTGEYHGLDEDVFRMTGRRIAIFQGSYEGKSFSMGGPL